MGEKAYWLALQRIRGLGPVKLRKVTEFFGSAARAWEATALELKEIKGLDSKTINNILEAKKKVCPEKELAAVEKLGIKILTIDDFNYPASLKEIYAPPPVLYLKGNLLSEDQKALAIVGSRKATFYGLRITEELSRQLGENGVTVVSGLARGVDTAAHQGALKGNGRTIAVLGCGLNFIYPPENKKLMAQVMEQGAVITEFALGTPPEANNFPMRNRVISGLSLGVLVIEAAQKSGSLITVDFALEQGREVFAVPGMITNKQSEGTNNLIKQGAKLVQSINDILEELGWSSREISLTKEGDCGSLSQDEKIILAILGNQPKHLDNILRETKLNFSQVFNALTQLEINGLVAQLPGKLFLRF